MTTVLVMKVCSPRDSTDHRVFIPVWLQLIDPRGTYSWVSDRTLATPMSEEDACAWMLQLPDAECLPASPHAVHAWLYYSTPV